MEQKGFSQDWLDKLKFNNDIVSVISKYLPLKKNGKTFWACCPFHHEKTPSFAINSQGQYYHCFGCGVGGNVINFIQKIEGVDFLEAVKILAKNANMEVPAFTEDKSIQEKRKRIELYQKICTDSAKFYNKVLNSNAGTKARQYLDSRSVTPSTITRMGLGYSPDWTSLINHLHKLGYTNKQMVEAGVAGEKDGRVYDFMANRLVFPVINHQNKVVGFSGRALEKTAFAKYKNTSQTEIFNKSSVIFGLHTLRKARLNLNYAILVEGQMDVVSLYQAGFENAIATMGTAFNKNHVNILSRFVDKVVVCFDGDSAGQKATERSLEPLLAENFDIKVISLPEKLDPDEFIKKYGHDKFQELLDNAQEVYEFEILNLINKSNLKDKRELAILIDKLLEIVSTIKNEVESQEYIKLIANKTGVDVELLNRKLRANLFNKSNNQENGQNDVIKKENNDNKSVLRDKNYYAEQFILASVLSEKGYVKDFTLKKEYFTFDKFSEFVEYMLEQKTKNVATLLDYFNENEEFLKLINFNFESIVDAPTYFNECIKTCELNYLANKQEEIKKQISVATDFTLKSELLKQLQQITKEIQTKRVEE